MESFSQLLSSAEKKYILFLLRYFPFLLPDFSTPELTSHNNFSRNWANKDTLFLLPALIMIKENFKPELIPKASLYSAYWKLNTQKENQK